MNVNSVSNTNFRALDYKMVVARDIGYVKDELKELQKLGKQYDIKLKSDFIELGLRYFPYRIIHVTVSPLKEKLGYLAKIFRPKATAVFYTNKAPYPEAENETLCDIVQQAIKYLQN